MSWLKLDDQFVDHPKILRAAQELGGRHARPRIIAAWVAAASYASRHLTDGFIASSAIGTVLAHERRPNELVAAFVSASLWVEVEGGFEIHDYLEFNPSAAQVRKRREYQRDHKARSRARNASNDGESRNRDPDDTLEGDLVVDSASTVDTPSTRSRPAVVSRARGTPAPIEPRTQHTRRSEIVREIQADASDRRVRAFLELYQAEHLRRRGSPYLPSPGDLELLEALVATCTDPELADMVRFWLDVEDPSDAFLDQGGRTIAKFRARATWCREHAANVRDQVLAGVSALAFRALSRDGRVWLELADLELVDGELIIHTNQADKLRPYVQTLLEALEGKVARVVLSPHQEPIGRPVEHHVEP